MLTKNIKSKNIQNIGIYIFFCIFSIISNLAASSKDTMPKAVLSCIEIENPRIGMFSNDPVLNYGLYLNQDLYLFDPKKYTYSPPKTPIPIELEGKHYFQLDKTKAHSFWVHSSGDILIAIPDNNDNRMPTILESADNNQAQEVHLASPYSFDRRGEDIGFRLYKIELQAGKVLQVPPGVIVAGFSPVRSQDGELLYNGIRLSAPWPPKIEWESDEPIPVPYLLNPPEVIKINVGRQLFVDDFLIESVDGLTKEFHYPEKLNVNPVLKPETSLETGGPHKNPVAAPKSGGLWWNPEKGIFELWYEAGWLNTLAYATSSNGVTWNRPPLGISPPSNQVLATGIAPDSVTVVKDYHTTDQNQRFKLFLRSPGCPRVARGFVSGDGKNFTEVVSGGLCGDRSTMFYNPFRSKWIFSLRWANARTGRARYYWESADFIKGMQWMPDDPVPWARTDKLDPPDDGIGNRPQLYNLDAVAYESIMLGFFQIHHGPENEVVAAQGLPKITGLNFAYSRDGFHWSRPDRNLAIESEQDEAWDRGYVQSLGNICVVRGDELWFYYIGFAGDENRKMGAPGVESSNESGLYANGSMGVAVLRRDGFVSLNAGSSPGILTTRPIVFSGKHLFVNADASGGSLVAEIVGLDGTPIPPFTFDNCVPIQTDGTIMPVQWKGEPDLSRLSNVPVKVRFKSDNCKLFAFWVSIDETGRSDGFVAGGGPGYDTNIDTVGKAAIQADKEFRK